MKVFFNFAYRAKPDRNESIQTVVNFLKKKRIDVVSLEVQSYEDLLGKAVVKKFGESADRANSDPRLHYQYVRKGMSIADAAILEVSDGDFRLGHEATLSLLLNKPVLCLSETTDFSVYILHPLFYTHRYTSQEDLKTSLETFIDEYRRKFLHIRFNGYLSPEQKNFLDWYGMQTGKNASEVVRILINERIKENPDFLDRQLENTSKSL